MEAPYNSLQKVAFELSRVRPMLRHAQRSMADDEDEELPWCSICNEDAGLRCRDCEGDLFCGRCFRECHGEFEMDHKAEKYSNPAKGKRKK